MYWCTFTCDRFSFSWWMILACELSLTIKHILIQLFRTDYTQFFVKCWLFLSWFSQLCVHPRWISVPDPWFVTKNPCWRGFSAHLTHCCALCSFLFIPSPFSLPHHMIHSFIRSFLNSFINFRYFRYPFIRSITLNLVHWRLYCIWSLFIPFIHAHILIHSFIL